MGNFKLIQTEGDVLNRVTYKFIVWDVNEQSNVKIYGEGEWSDWDYFREKVRKYWDQANERSEDGIDASKGVSVYIAENLLKIVLTEPHFVSEVKKYNKQSPFARAMYWMFERVGIPILIISVIVFFAWGLGSAFWRMGQETLGSMGLIEFQNKGEKRYETFLGSVSGCQLTDAVRSSTKTDKWPVYAIYKCPDGSKKVWKRSVDVITEVGDKLIVE